MGKLVVMDECLVPRRLSWLYYKGPNPTGFLRGIRDHLEMIFEVSTTRCLEKKLLWNYTGDPVKFYSEWIVIKEMSRFTTINFHIRVFGGVSKGTNEGSFSMELFGEIEHTFAPSNWLMKYFWIFYNYLFYSKAREQYSQMCKEYIGKFLTWFKEKHGLKVIGSAQDELDNLREDHGLDEERLRKEAKETEPISEGKPEPPGEKPPS